MNKPDNSFIYNDLTYLIGVILFAPTDKIDYSDVFKKDDAPKVLLDYSHIKKIEYTNDMLNTLIYGYVDYEDKYNDINIYLGLPYVYCGIYFSKQTINNGANIDDPDNTFIHIFLVSSINVISKNSNVFRYRINLVSHNWWKFAANVLYSNWGSDKESPYDIIQKLFSNNGLRITVPEKLNIQEKIHYSTSPNDTLLTAYKYLLSKSYQDPTNFSSNNICPIIYNDVKDEYKWIDLSNLNTFDQFKFDNNDCIATIIISLLDNIVGFNNSPRTTISSANILPRFEIYNYLKKTNTVSYTHETGMISNALDITQLKKVTLLNNRCSFENSIDKYQVYDKTASLLQKLNTDDFTQLNFTNIKCDWCNDSNYYTDVLKILKNADNIIINTPGYIAHRPGLVVNLLFDQSEEDAIKEETNIKEYQALKTKMIGFMGVWYITEVRHVIDFNINLTKPITTFRDYITLSRNFKVG